MGAFDSWPSALGQANGGLGLAQQQLGAYTASGSDWVHATQTVNVNFDDMYALRQPEKIAPRGKESAVEWLDRRVAEICVKL